MVQPPAALAHRTGGALEAIKKVDGTRALRDVEVLWGLWLVYSS